jgi:hypothetical protein
MRVLAGRPEAVAPVYRDYRFERCKPILVYQRLWHSTVGLRISPEESQLRQEAEKRQQTRLGGIVAATLRELE